jgi:hypothetical protein
MVSAILAERGGRLSARQQALLAAPKRSHFGFAKASK